MELKLDKTTKILLGAIAFSTTFLLAAVMELILIKKNYYHA